MKKETAIKQFKDMKRTLESLIGQLETEQAPAAKKTTKTTKREITKNKYLAKI